MPRGRTGQTVEDVKLNAEERRKRPSARPVTIDGSTMRSSLWQLSPLTCIGSGASPFLVRRCCRTSVLNACRMSPAPMISTLRELIASRFTGAATADTTDADAGVDPLVAAPAAAVVVRPTPNLANTASRLVAAGFALAPAAALGDAAA